LQIEGTEGQSMPLTLEWTDVALRLALTVLAGGVIGINRSERGRAAGLRTTLLVCLAASVCMILSNLLLATSGKTPDLFATFDVLRLPLGILTGMGFIGGGAILRRGELVVGVTTAATLWFATVIGLCFGSGQLGLGLAALALAAFTLWALKWLELRLHQDRRGVLTLRAGPDGPGEDEMRAWLLAAGCWFTSWAVSYAGHGAGQRRVIRAEVRWRARATDFHEPAFLHELARRPGVLAVRWKVS
jgi:putative Mg2+ transporter-C (MgtC) family protein